MTWKGALAHEAKGGLRDETMWRCFRILHAILLVGGACAHAWATTTDFRLTPDKLKATTASPLNFTIKVDRLKDGNLLFRVAVTTKGQPFRADASTGLAEETKDQNGAYAGILLRSLPAEKAATTLTCIFVVPEKAIEDPELCFQLQNVENGNGDVYSVSLKDLVDFYKP
jgi:hypothetical protein